MQCPTHLGKLQRIQQNGEDTKCQMCSRPSMIQCASCPFTLCDFCRICNKKHFLVRLVQLCKVNTAYHANGYSCNICKASKTANDDGVWHCNQCTYDICPECIQ